VLPFVPQNRSAPGVLSAAEFEVYFERERCLADRGTRLFSLMMLKRVDGDPLYLDRLSRHLIKRLRSTDLVGQLDRDHLAILLTDTGPTQARSIAGWIDRDVAGLGLRVESTIYVYPSVADAEFAQPPSFRGDDASTPSNHVGPNGHGPNGDGANGNGGNGHGGNGHGSGGNGRARRTAVPVEIGAQDRMEEDDFQVAPGKPPVEAAPAACQVEDLWPLLTVATPWWKRAIDIAVSAILILLLAPFFALVALAIKLDSPGPVIFKQRRAGRGGKPFTFYKFRSMFVDAEKRREELEALNEQGGPVFKIKNDPRMTRVGRIMRRWSIDETPQLWNVLRGDFSLVGPRPPTLNEVPGYERWQRRRLNVPGGLTCIWQVSGRNDVAFQDWMRMDMQYILRRGFWMDVHLLFRTVTAVVTGRGAY
jgi:lipopolysaccharide/colanic/teichoic acid biosynthesis glycosyltransferase